MSPLISGLLALVQAAPGAWAEIKAVIAAVRPSALPADQPALDHLIGLFEPTVDQDIDNLHAAAAGAAQE